LKMNYEENARIIKAFADPGRLRIIDILSCGEQCACTLLEEFNFTQPTLSHHMKVLVNSGLVECRKEGLWSYYSLKKAACDELIFFVKNLVTDTEDCICKETSKGKCE